MTPSRSSVPELGPLLGKLSSPAPRGPVPLPLDDIRFRLLDSLYQAAAAARREDAAGRREAAVAALGHAAWLGPWQEAVNATATRVLEELDRRFETAATESRIPARLLSGAKPSEDDRRSIRARVEAAGIPLERAMFPERGGEWADALLRAAMALDDSWDRLEGVVGQELRGWQVEVERVRAWRRPTAPLWWITALVLLLAVALGLALGGYLPAPGPLQALQQFFWSLPWR